MTDKSSQITLREEHAFRFRVQPFQQLGDDARLDPEVEESRWVSFDEAMEMLDFKSERDVVEKARTMIKELTPDS